MTGRLIHCRAIDLQVGDVLHNRAGAPMFTVADVDHRPGLTVVTTTTWDVQRGWSRAMEIQPAAPAIVLRGADQ